jgi:hypothetical protein
LDGEDIVSRLLNLQLLSLFKQPAAGPYPETNEK